MKDTCTVELYGRENVLYPDVVSNVVTTIGRPHSIICTVNYTGRYGRFEKYRKRNGSTLSIECPRQREWEQLFGSIHYDSVYVLFGDVGIDNPHARMHINRLFPPKAQDDHPGIWYGRIERFRLWQQLIALHLDDRVGDELNHAFVSGIRVLADYVRTCPFDAQDYRFFVTDRSGTLSVKTSKQLLRNLERILDL
ncbi:hypothetical protein HY490_01340 [Candidatus Woesearchaeota archaeon]|nr:hypothetical protein [Candidatus Woesearchaeota archaeon]